MGNFKELQANSLESLSRFTNQDRIDYPVTLITSESSAKRVLHQGSVYFDINSKEEMLDQIADFAQFILEEDVALKFKVVRTDLLPTDEHIHACLN